MNDFGLVFTEEEKQACADIKGRFNRQNFEHNLKYSSLDEYKRQSESKQIWEIPFMRDTFDEDNDTEEEESSDSDEEAKIDGMVDALKDLLSGDGSKKLLKQIAKGGGLKFFVT